MLHDFLVELGISCFVFFAILHVISRSYYYQILEHIKKHDKEISKKYNNLKLYPFWTYPSMHFDILISPSKYEADNYLKKKVKLFRTSTIFMYITLAVGIVLIPFIFMIQN
jgi:hypothetical protein